MAAVAKKHDLTSDPVDPTSSAKMAFRSAGPSFATGDFLKTLFGVLLERETSEESLLLFEALFALALANGSLTISVVPALDFTFTFAENPSPNDILAALAEKFSSWDIARL